MTLEGEGSLQSLYENGENACSVFFFPQKTIAQTYRFTEPLTSFNCYIPVTYTLDGLRKGTLGHLRKVSFQISLRNPRRLI